jgi:membrane dipeptidase
MVEVTVSPRASIGRRHFLQVGAAGLAWGVRPVSGQPRVPIADMHSHYGMITRRLADSGLAEEMRSQGVVLVAWKLVADGPWLQVTRTGIEQAREPAPGELATHFDRTLERMKAYIAAQGLRTVLTSADVDACVAGSPGIVLASEGADFLEGRLDGLEPAYAKGLRHLQLVHYIRTPVGDFQTTAPTHHGLSPLGQQLVQACNRRGVLVDLAHSTGPAVEQALAISTAPMVWSHSWVEGDGGHWRDPVGYLQRRLSLALARKIAARGGVVGLWGLGLSQPGRGWPVTRSDTQGYARELARLADTLGPDHVAFGTDIEGVGPNWSVNDYGHVRRVVEHLQDMKLDPSIIARLAYGNYARVLKAALSAPSP